MLERDVNNITAYYGLYAPELLGSNYAKEMWALYEEGELTPETILTGLFQEDETAADVDGVMLEIKAVMEEEEKRQQRLLEAEQDEE